MAEPLVTRKTQLSAAKRALLAERLKGKAKPAIPVISRREPGAVVPLSFSQQRLWFLYQFEPDNPFYNVPFGLHLRGKLDTVALEQVLQTLMQRHEILRTTFADTTQDLEAGANGDGQPQQIVHPSGITTLQKIDLSALGTQTWTEVERLAQSEAHQPFNLYEGPLLRVTLVTVAEQEFVLLVTLHHIISDVWSTGLLVKEMAMLYHAFTQTKNNPLPPLSIQYADFTLWQRQQLQGEYLQKQISYWQQQFSTIPAVLQLPTDRPRPAAQSFCGDCQNLAISAELTNGLKRLGQATDATLFMTVLAAFKVLLYRYTGQTDITVGSPIANRNQAAIEGLIGLFMNTLALRTQLDGNPSFRDVLMRVRETALGAYGHQDLPFEKLIDVLSLPRELSHTPLFQVMLVLQNAPSSSLQLPDLTLDLLELPNNTSKFDLTMTLTEVDGGVQGVIEYNTDLFDSTTIDRLLSHFQVLLTEIIANPDACLSEFSLLTPGEAKQLEQWRQTDELEFSPSCLHQCFEARVENNPDAIAITVDQDHLTYGELNQRANRLAHYLRDLGVGPDMLVGLCIERSLDMVVGILGILKAGGAYVPLDPTYPSARLKFMFQDSDISVLVTQSSLLKDIPASSLKVVALDGDGPSIAQAASDNLDVNVTADNLAYIIYTSGSTGTPKGVMIPHQNVVRLFKAADCLYHFDHQDCWTLFHSYAFDFSVWELWGALLYGGRLVVVPYWVSRSPQDFYQLLLDQQVTVLNQTPSAFNQLIQIDGDYPADGLSLRYVIFGGEALAVESLRPWFERHGDTQPQLVNMYGITETTVHVTHRLLTKADLDRASSPIGRPLADLQCTILDPYLQPVPIGIPGELHVGGAGLARGYLNRSELTSERFIDNPFGSGRLYKTGDLVKYLPDGTLDYLGRIDHQVKIRGFRIELGEIEAALQQHPLVRETLVMVRTEQSTQSRLVAYLSVQSSAKSFGTDGDTAPCSVKELRQWLQERLPDYMVPSAFVWLPQMPLNANGKIDRTQLQTLPIESLNQASVAAPFVAPRSHIEQQLADIWARVLENAAVGIDDNFFELGGDSILSLQIITQANQAGLQLTLKQLFQHQTIRALAPVVESVIPVDQGPVVGLVPLTPSQHQWFEHGSRHAFSTWVTVALHQSLSLDNLQGIVHHLLNHHDALRGSFQGQEADWQQDIAPPLAALDSLPSDVVTTVQVEENISREIATAVADFQTNLDLTKGNLFRAVLMTTVPEEPQHLLLIAHPLVIDRVSWSILLEDFQTLLHQRTQHQPFQLSAKTTSLKQWAEQLQTHGQTLHQEPIAQQPPPIPLDFDAKESTLGSKCSTTVSLDIAETQRLLQEVPLAYRTHTQEVILTALVQAYGDWAGDPQLTIDVASDSRNHPFDNIDLSRTVGLFTSLCPLALNLNTVDSLGDALKTIKEQVRNESNQHLDHSVWRYLTQQQPLAKQPRPDVCFCYCEPCPEPDALSIIESSDTYLGYDHRLYIEGCIVEGQLQMSWSYNPTLHRSSTIEPLVQSFLQKLRALIAHCLSPDAGGFTPSDFPLAKLEQTALDNLAARYPQLEDCYPLTPIQQGFLFHALYAPEEGLYMNQLQCRLRGNLDIDALKETWQRISNRHPILRTAFAWENLDQPLQVVHRQVTVPWQSYDWRSQSPEDQESKFAALLQQDLAAGLQSHIAPLMRVTLIRVADDCYEIVWSCHHMLLDGWSMPMVIQEIFTLYESLVQGKMPVLEDRRPYRDYIAWLASQDLGVAETFWKSLLQGFRIPTPLGYQTTQGAAPNHKIQGLTLSHTTATALQTLARQQYLTLNTMLQGAWSILISHISGQNDIVFGATTAGRPPTIHGADKMVGLFINTLPVRVQITAELEIMTWLQAIQTQQSESRQFEYSPLNQIQRWSEVPTGSPLFESLIVFENYRVDPAMLSSQTNLEIQSVDTFQNNNYPLTLRVLPREEFVLEIMSDRTCFAAELTDRWLHYLESLVQWLVENPTATLGDWQAHLTVIDHQWQQQQAQTLTQTSLNKLRKTRRKAVRSSSQEGKS